MGESNGKIDIWKIMTAIIIPVLFFMGTQQISAENRRVDEDKSIRQEMSQDRKELATQLQLISGQLASINTELKYIKRNGRENITR